MSKVIFLHGAKTGGTSLRYMLLKEYGYERIAPVPLGASVLRQEYPELWGVYPLYHQGQITPEMVEGYDVVMSHYDWGIVDRLPEWQVITLLRNPVDQIYSLYRYMRQSVDFPNFTEPDFMNWVAGAGRFHMNHQTRVLSGHGSRYSLDDALRNLEDSRMCFGIMECFEASVRRWNACFGWSMEVEHLNKTKPTTPLSERQWYTVSKLQSDDMVLYRRAAEIFTEVDSGKL